MALPTCCEFHACIFCTCWIDTTWCRRFAHLVPVMVLPPWQIERGTSHFIFPLISAFWGWIASLYFVVIYTTFQFMSVLSFQGIKLWLVNEIFVKCCHVSSTYADVFSSFLWMCSCSWILSRPNGVRHFSASILLVSHFLYSYEFIASSITNIV